MKPRTKLEKQVDKLFRTLPPMTEAQHRWAFAKVFAHEAYWWDEMWCSECGNVMPRTDSARLVDLLDDEVTCPKCGARLKVVRSRKRKFKEREWVTVLTTCMGMQVARSWQIERVGAKGCETYKRAFEVVQLWLNEDGERCVVACNRNMHGFCDCWVPGTMSIKRPQPYANHYDWQGVTYPRRRVLPSILKRGWRNVPHVVDIELMQLLLKTPRAETLIKAGQLDMVRYMVARNWRAKDEWHAVKIALRRDYIVRDASVWVDYLHMLTELGKDTHNPKLVCPADLDKAHAAAQRKVERKRNEERKRMLREQIASEEPAYKQSKGIYLALVIKGSGITIRPLQSVAEFAEEGEKMHHCVFERDYYKRDDALILTARDAEGKRIETIEYNLDTHKVVQSRGVCNSKTKRHDEIVRLMRGSVNKIKSIQRRSPAGQKTRRPA